MAANSSLTQDVFPLTPGRVCQPEQAPGTLASWEIWQGQLQQARTAASGRPQLDSSQMLPKCRQWWAPLGTPSFSSTSGSRPCYHTPGRLRAIGQEGTQLPQPLPPAPLTADPRSEMGSAGYQTWPLGHSQGGERGGHDPGARLLGCHPMARALLDRGGRDSPACWAASCGCAGVGARPLPHQAPGFLRSSLAPSPPPLCSLLSCQLLPSRAHSLRSRAALGQARPLAHSPQSSTGCSNPWAESQRALGPAATGVCPGRHRLAQTAQSEGPGRSGVLVVQGTQQASQPGPQPPVWQMGTDLPSSFRLLWF